MAGTNEEKARCHLLSLPPELSVSVLSYVLQDSSKDLLNLVMSCRTMHEILKNNRPAIFRVVLNQLDPKELAIATAHYHATIPPWIYPKDLSCQPNLQEEHDIVANTTRFCDQYLCKQGTELRVPLQEFTLPMVEHIRQTHLAIHVITARLASLIVSQGFVGRAPSPVEIGKISKSLYIIDLVGMLFFKSPRSTHEHPRRRGKEHYRAFNKFWSCFAPWESAQVEAMIGCLQNYVKGISATTFIKIVMSKGMKNLVPLFCHAKFPEYDNELLALLDRHDHADRVVISPWEDIHRWFTPKHSVFNRHYYRYKNSVVLNEDVIRKYDADVDDASAIAWMVTSGHWPKSNTPPWTNSAMFTTGRLWGEYVRRDKWCCPYFWDLDRLLQATGCVPSLMGLFLDLGDGQVTMYHNSADRAYFAL
ncbi:hypothetical protein F5Y03DRAFT_399104 [Xylaria venustula]|nr:hypothetical protein F5Y03DRAFT_399104 [Xylaria venustula]